MKCRRTKLGRTFAVWGIAALAAFLLMTLPAMAAAGPQDSSQQQTSGDQQSSSRPPPDPAVQQQQNPDVKPGSKADVNAIGDRGVGKGLDFYSLDREVALGKQLSQQVDRTAKLITDPVVTEYVNRLEQNLARNSDCREPITAKVIDSDQVNAFALPGGFLYVNSGLILRADEESELAGVMGHETAHICLRHGTKNATKQDIVQLASIPAMMFIPYSLAGLAMYQGMNLAIPVAFLKFSRDEERQADYFGLQYMYKAGYDPNSFVSFFEEIAAAEKKQPGTVATIFADHPPTPDRIEAIQKEIAKILPARDQYVVTTSEFDAVKKRLEMIEMNQKVDNGRKRGPTLRKETKNPTTADGGSTDDSDDSDRPTLKRRPADQQP
jgi:beta-barrel assembly-enhancing protease